MLIDINNKCCYNGMDKDRKYDCCQALVKEQAEYKVLTPTPVYGTFPESQYKWPSIDPSGQFRFGPHLKLTGGPSSSNCLPRGMSSFVSAPQYMNFQGVILKIPYGTINTPYRVFELDNLCQKLGCIHFSEILGVFRGSDTSRRSLADSSQGSPVRAQQKLLWSQAKAKQIKAERKSATDYLRILDVSASSKKFSNVPAHA